MSRSSPLAGFAYNTAQQFAASANHLAYLAWRREVPVIEIDLLRGHIAPATPLVV